MQSLSRRSLLAATLALATTPAHAATDGVPDAFELPVEGMERLDANVWIKPLPANVWITCFTFAVEGLGDVAANGLIIAGEEGATIVDTGCNRAQGDVLLAAAARVTGRPAAQAIATHFHTDRTGGIDAMRVVNVPVYAHPYSVGLAQAQGFPVPQPVRDLEKQAVTLGPVELFYPGAGHTRDNITVWHAPTRMLYGGCLVRATTDDQIGSRGDADIAAYPATLARLADRYPTRAIIIPGHGAIAGDALAHSQALAAAL